MKLRKLPIGARALILAGVIVASPIAARAFSDPDLTGSFGCVGTSYSPHGDVTDLMQLNFDGAGGVTGSMHFLVSGEDCLASVGPGSRYSVNADGTGSLTLKLSFSGFDADRGLPCAKLNHGKSSSQKIDFVLERAAKVFDFASQDDFSGAPTDLGDAGRSFTGKCTDQVSF